MAGLSISQQLALQTGLSTNVAIPGVDFFASARYLSGDYEKIAVTPSDFGGIDIKSYGAVGDGTSHPLYEFFDTVGEAQAAGLTVATNLNHEIDQVALQQAMYDQVRFYVGDGTYMCNYQADLSAKSFYWVQSPHATIKGGELYVVTGNATAGASSTITLASSASTVSNFYAGMILVITAGKCAGQTRKITAYSTGRVATVEFAWVGDTPDATTVYEIRPSDMFSFTNCTGRFQGVTLDGDHKYQCGLYFGNTTDTRIVDFYGHHFGYTGGLLAGTLVTPVYFSGDIGKVRVHNYKVSHVQATGDNSFGNLIGGARAIMVAPQTNTSTVDVYIDELYFDATGSNAEELDIININTGATYPSRIVLNNPVMYYNGNVRRCFKAHSGDCVIINPQIHKASDFVTAPTAVGATDVGEKNWVAIDFAGTGQGSITVIGGIVNCVGFPSGFSNSSSSTDSYVRAYGTEFIGATKQVDRINPQTGSPEISTPISFVTGSSDKYSGCDTCIFTEGYVPAQLRGYYSYLTNCTFDDPVYHAWWFNPTTSARKNYLVKDPLVITRTPGRLSTGFRIVQIQVTTDFMIVGARLIQDGNTTHVGTFIDINSTGCAGYVIGTTGPATYTSGAFTLVRKNVNCTVKIVATNWAMESLLHVNTTPVGNVNTGADTLQTYTVLGRTTGEIGQGILIKATGNFADNTNDKTLKYQIGTNTTTGACQGAAAGSLTLASGASSTTNFYIGQEVEMTSGAALGEKKTITAYDGGTKIATLSSNWTVTPTAADTYSVNYQSPVNLTLPTSVAGSWDLTMHLWNIGVNSQFYEWELEYTYGSITDGDRSNAVSYMTDKKSGSGTFVFLDNSNIVLRGQGTATTSNDIVQNFHYIKTLQ